MNVSVVIPRVIFEYKNQAIKAVRVIDVDRCAYLVEVSYLNSELYKLSNNYCLLSSSGDDSGLLLSRIL